jgi:hypothetical protein
VAGCLQGNELSGSIKGGEFLDWLSYCCMELVISRSHLVCLVTRVYTKVSGLAAWSEKCKWYSSLPLGAVVSLFCESL